MRLVEFLSLMEQERGDKLYHGVNTTKQGEFVLKNGIVPPNRENPRAYLAPVKGRVYLTPDIRLATIHALGGVMMGHDDPRVGALKKDPYGYIFTVEKTDFLEDIWPDEDAVGEVWMLAREIRQGKEDTVKKYYGELATARLALNDEQTRGWMSMWSSRGTYNISPRMERLAAEGDIMWQAKLGKMMLRKMPDWLKKKFIDAGTALSVKGTVRPTEAWRVDRRRSEEIANNANNIFDIAERIQ